MDTKNIQKLTQFSAIESARLLKNEHPQVIGTILTLLPEDYSVNVLSSLSERLQADVSLRLLTLESIDSYWIDQLDETIGQLIEEKKLSKLVSLGGIEKSSRIFAKMKSRKKDFVMDSIREYDFELADQVSLQLKKEEKRKDHS